MTALDWLPGDEARAVRAVVDAVARGAGEKLVGVAVVGAWVPPAWSTVADRVELLIVLSDHHLARLDGAGPLLEEDGLLAAIARRAGTDAQRLAVMPNDCGRASASTGP